MILLRVSPSGSGSGVRRPSRKVVRIRSRQARCVREAKALVLTLSEIKDVLDLHRQSLGVLTMTYPERLNPYRNYCNQEKTRKCGVRAQVAFGIRYRDVAALRRFVASASTVTARYETREQVTSGVLVDSIAAGRPVIATAFPHAVELLKNGAGMVVPHADPKALAGPIKTIISDPQVSEDMAAEARRLATSFSWFVVAGEYGFLVDDLVHSRQLVTR
ncbi:MAG TPA: glycosyltransferase [Candidatus Nanopelagicaceae bacterium]|nr:glycosyltransferase [Candidatus Nanopelagicaceae bacterium]